MTTVSITLTPESKRNIARLKAIGGKAALREALTPFFKRQASLAAGHIVRNYLSGQRLKRRTGNLARSVVGVTEVVRGMPAMRVGIMSGPALRYAGPLEYGTKGKNPESPYDTIRPKNARALAIPRGPALTAAGVDRRNGPRGYPQGMLTFIPFRGSGVAVGGLFLTSSLTRQGGQRRNTETGQFEPGFKRVRVPLRQAIMYYLLVKKVDLEPRWYLRDGFTSYLPELTPELTRYLRDYVVGARS